MSNKLKGLTEEYLQDVLVRLAHHSSAIEGNTISLADTVSIILHQTVPGKANLREIFEVANHKGAFEYVIQQIANNQSLTVGIIKHIHALLTDRLLIDPGKFKQNENAIIGADFATASPQETPLLMDQWVGNLNYRLSHCHSELDILKVIGDFHIQFERIHPFSDGNGRVGRMLMNYSLLEKALPPLIIRGEHKAEYLNIISNQDAEKFAEFSLKLIGEEKKQIQKFMNKANSTLNDI